MICSVSRILTDVPFVPTVNASELENGSVDTISEAKNATPFALRAPTNLPQGYEFVGFQMNAALGPHSYGLGYSQEPNSTSDIIHITVVAPPAARDVTESDRPNGSHSVTVGNQTGYYTPPNETSGMGKTGSLQFTDSDGWEYDMIGPGKKELVQTAKSIEVVEGNATE